MLYNTYEIRNRSKTNANRRLNLKRSVKSGPTRLFRLHNYEEYIKKGILILRKNMDYFSNVKTLISSIKLALKDHRPDLGLIHVEDPLGKYVIIAFKSKATIQKEKEKERFKRAQKLKKKREKSRIWHLKNAALLHELQHNSWNSDHKKRIRYMYINTYKNK